MYIIFHLRTLKYEKNIPYSLPQTTMTKYSIKKTDSYTKL